MGFNAAPRSEPLASVGEQQSECANGESANGENDCQASEAIQGKLKIFTTETWGQQEPEYVSSRDVLLMLEPSIAASIWLDEIGRFDAADEQSPILTALGPEVMKQAYRLEGNEGVVKVWAKFRSRESGSEITVYDDVVLDLTDPSIAFDQQGIVKTPSYSAKGKVTEANLSRVECKSAADASFVDCQDSMTELDFTKTLSHPLDGVFVLEVRLEDKAGRSFAAVHSYQVDSHKPLISLKNVPSGKFNSSTVKIGFQATDDYQGNQGSGIEHFYCSFDSGASFVEGAAKNCDVRATASADIYELNMKTTNAGKYNVVLKVKDKAGHESDPSTAVSFEIDQSQPTLTVTPPNYYQTSSSVAIPFEGSWPTGGNYTVKYSCQLASGGAIIKVDGNCTAPGYTFAGLAGSTPGKEYVATITATFTRGGEPPYVQSKELRFFVDLDNPTATLAYAPGQAGTTNGSIVNVLITAADAGSGINASSLKCYVQKSAGAVVSLPCQMGASSLNITNLADGDYSVYFQVSDQAGRGPVTSNKLPLTVDRTPSQISISGPGVPMAGFTGVPNRVDGSAKPSFQIRADASVNATQGIKCTMAGLFTDLACGASGFVLPANLPSSGPYELLVKVTDGAGNLSQNSFAWFYDKTPPQVGLGSFPANSYSGSKTNIPFSIVDTMSEITTVTCYLRPPGAVAGAVGCGYTPEKVGSLLSIKGSYGIDNLVVGTYEFWVEAIDKSNNKGASAHGTYAVTEEIKLVDKTKTIRSIDNKQIDILMVLDSSGSMQEELKGLAAKFSDFFSVLQGYDWRIGFVMNELKEGARVVCSATPNSYVAGKSKCPIGNGLHYDKAMIMWNNSAVWNESVPGFDGRLLDIDGAANTYWITPSSPNASNLFLNTLQVHLPKTTGYYVGRTDSSGKPAGLPPTQHERGLSTFRRVLERFKDGSFSGINKSFFRSNAHLAAINISDEDESNLFQADNATHLSYMDSSKYILPCIGKVVTGEPCTIKHDTAQQTYDLLKQTLPNRNFVWNSIVTYPSGVTSATDDAGWNAHCVNKPTTGTNIGCFYRDMSQLTGGKVVNIAETGSYTQYLREIGEITKQLARKIDLDCAPYQNKVTLLVNGAAVNIAYVIKGSTAEYQQDLPAGDYTVNYQCQIF